jgi:hypothetical protein
MSDSVLLSLHVVLLSPYMLEPDRGQTLSYLKRLCNDESRRGPLGAWQLQVIYFRQAI